MMNDFPFSFSLPDVPKGEITTAGEAEKRLLLQFQKSSEVFEDSIWQIARFYQMTGDPDKAFAWIQRLMSFTRSAEKQASYYFTLGQIMEGPKKFQAAVDFYTQAQALEPKTELTRYFSNNNLGFCLNQLGDYDAAEPYCREAIAIDSERHNAFKNLGVSLEGRKKFVEAARAYIQAVQRQARDARALHHLESLVDSHPRIREAIVGFDELLKGCREAVDLAEKMEQGMVASKVGQPPTSMTNAMKILDAVHKLVFEDGHKEITRDDVRRKIGLSRDEWMAGFTAIFQAMRADQPVGAPRIREEYREILKRVKHGIYQLTHYGEEYVRSKRWQIIFMG